MSSTDAAIWWVSETFDGITHGPLMEGMLVRGQMIGIRIAPPADPAEPQPPAAKGEPK